MTVARNAAARENRLRETLRRLAAAYEGRFRITTHHPLSEGTGATQSGRALAPPHHLSQNGTLPPSADSLSRVRDSRQSVDQLRLARINGQEGVEGASRRTRRS